MRRLCPLSGIRPVKMSLRCCCRWLMLMMVYRFVYGDDPRRRKCNYFLTNYRPRLANIYSSVCRCVCAARWSVCSRAGFNALVRTRFVPRGNQEENPTIESESERVRIRRCVCVIVERAPAARRKERRTHATRRQRNATKREATNVRKSQRAQTLTYEI